MEPRETALTGSTRVNSGVKSILSVRMHRKPRTRGLLGGWQRFGVDAWEEPERQWLAKAQTWRPRGQQATWEYQLQATGINFLYAGRAVPVGPGTQAVPRDAASRALWQAEPMPSSQQKWA